MLCVFALTIAGSCQKSTEDSPAENTATNQLKTTNAETTQASNERYFIDGREVSQSQFDWQLEGYSYHINVGEKNNPASETIFNLAFSTPKLYDSYMRSEIGEIYDIQEAITAHLAQYAEESGAVEYLEKYGEVPKWYLEYESAYLAEHMPKRNAGVQDRGLVCVLFKNLYCNEAFNITIPLLGTPFFVFNNNEASSMTGLLIGGYHKCFDKSFYRKKIFSITVWAMNCINFPAAYEDRASSWWCIGV